MMSCDVVIMGGGIAGAFLARQLKLTRPELDIRVLEAAATIDDYKVGESTVEVAAHYMIRRLNLGTYLYQHQLPKNGLRFFFDSPAKDRPLTKMSEIGSDRLPFHPSFQLERASLERDLAAMNRASGVTVELGAKVVEEASRVNSAPGPHSETTYVQSGRKAHFRARLALDASGRRHLLSCGALGEQGPSRARLPTAAAWGRYSNVAGLDAVRVPGLEAASVRWTSRHLSTNHFMYDGYWLWFIPLAGDLMSVGAVYDKARLPSGPRNREAFEAFMRSHRSSRDLLEGAVLQDFQSYVHLPYYSDVYFSKDRWGVTGEAGAFTDPFYSPGSDFIATANEFLTSMIVSDLDGDAALLREKADAYNAFYRFKYERDASASTSTSIKTFGSFELFRLKYLLDFNNYYNLVVWPFAAEASSPTSPWIQETSFALSDRILQAQTAHGRSLLGHGRATPRGRRLLRPQRRGVGQWPERRLAVRSAARPVARRRLPARRRAAGVRQRVRVSPRADDGDGRALHAPERVLAELDLPAVLLFHKDINEGTVQRFLQRVAGRISPGLAKQSSPEAAIEGVQIDPADGSRVRVMGAASEAGSLLEARATQLWNERAESLTSIRL